MVLQRCTLLAVALTANAARIDPAHAVNITVYHINPRAMGAIPVNMDSGNALGDLLFDLLEVILSPLSCRYSKKQGRSCTNPEAVGKDLMVNQLTLEVNSCYSRYAKCNIGVNGTDQRGHPCKDGTYCCFCNDPQYSGRTVPCNDTVGRENLKTHFGGGGGSHHYFGNCRCPMHPDQCYAMAVFSKLNSSHLDGWWYSSLKQGYCDADAYADASTSCMWRVVSIDKIVTRKCHTEVFGNFVQATQPSACLDACGDQKMNTSSPCWTDCFFKAAMGPTSGQPGGKIEGMSLDDLVSAWVTPFLPEDQGGCPRQQEVTPWFANARVAVVEQ